MVFRLHAINANEGDCLLLEYGNKEPRYMLFDGGPKDIWTEHLEPTLRRLGNPTIDVMALTHVDTDHTTGLRDMLSALQAEVGDAGAASITVGALWMNAFDEILDEDGALRNDLESLMSMAAAASVSLAATGFALQGVKDGNDVRVRAALLGIKRNPPWEGKPILVGANPGKVTLENLTFTTVGPTKGALDDLKAEWKAWIAKQRARLNDNKPAFAAMADKSVPNLSSLQFLVEAGGRRLLLTGDGRGDHLLEGLAAAELLDEGEGIDVDVLKLPHHGSDRNVNRDFFRRVRAQTYVVSADGKNGNPDLATLQWIVEEAKRAARRIDLVATNSTDSIDQLLASHPPAENGYHLQIRSPNRHRITIDLQD